MTKTPSLPEDPAASTTEADPVIGASQVRASSGPWTRLWRVLFSLGVIASLALNVLLITALAGVRKGLLDTLATARNGLALAESQAFVIDVAVDQQIPIQASVPVEQTIRVPFQLDYQLSTVVNTYVDLPVLGRQDLALPVEAVIPIETTLEVPIQTTVPISLTYPLQVAIPVEIEVPSTLADSLDEALQQLEQELSFGLR
jgi:hypothetical protein